MAQARITLCLLLAGCGPVVAAPALAPELAPEPIAPLPAPAPSTRADACARATVTLRIYAGAAINPNMDGRPRPVVVRLYQLSAREKMTSASFDDLVFDAHAALGAELAGKEQEVVIYPNDLVELTLERSPSAAFLGAAALFVAPVAWKTIHELPRGEGGCTADVALFVDDRSLDDGTRFDASMFPNVVPRPVP